ncbi:Uncharacterised protein [Mycobacteroides abscessus subsp. abscessus]|nr:Uncharacterised protein [Mycobacteroides abscessus subsp. abscessus]SKV06846.1 Uncharacterised protein [Mycobacteroides abscessus subsp. abscessus]
MRWSFSSVPTEESPTVSSISTMGPNRSKVARSSSSRPPKAA